MITSDNSTYNGSIISLLLSMWSVAQIPHNERISCIPCYLIRLSEWTCNVYFTKSLFSWYYRCKIECFSSTCER